MLVGDGIENPANALLLSAAAGLLGTTLLLRDRRTNTPEAAALPPGATAVTPAALEARRPLLVCETDPEAVPVYGFRSPSAGTGALIVGNERRGVAHDLRAMADHTVGIPLAPGRLSSLNVAAAATVALYHVGNPLSTRPPIRRRSDRHRPALLLLAPMDHFEPGSTLRSAAAFGWSSAMVDDRHNLWFGVERGVRAEGRAAARRARNAIRLIRSAETDHHAFDEVVVVQAGGDAIPLQRTRLTGGDRQLVVLPDETLGPPTTDWVRLGTRVTFATLGLPGGSQHYRYRLAASIALSEIARQLGTVATQPAPTGKQGLGYRSQLEVTSPPALRRGFLGGTRHVLTRLASVRAPPQWVWPTAEPAEHLVHTPQRRR